MTPDHRRGINENFKPPICWDFLIIFGINQKGIGKEANA
jgi:hypothetical protein